MLIAALPLLAVLATYQWLREHVLIPLPDAWNRCRNEPRTIWRMAGLALLIATVIAADANLGATLQALALCFTAGVRTAAGRQMCRRVGHTAPSGRSHDGIDAGEVRE
jgi:hypothetical protein